MTDCKQSSHSVWINEGNEKNVQTLTLTWSIRTPCPYMVNILQIFLSRTSRPIPWNFVCNIEYSSITRLIEMITFGRPWRFNDKDKFGKMLELIILWTVSEIVAKIGIYICLNECMKFFTISSQCYSLTFAKDSHRMTISDIFSKRLGQSSPDFIRSLLGLREENLFKWSKSNYQHVGHAPYMVKYLQKSSCLAPLNRWTWAWY